MLVIASVGAPGRAVTQQPAPPAAPAGAGAVLGTVTDSISGAALAGATIQLARRDNLDVAYTTTSDRWGSFRLEGLAPGEYLAGFFHPRLDSLGLESPTYLVQVGGGDTPLALAIASPATIAAQACQLAPADSSGLLLGHVRDADTRQPLDGARLTVRWPEVVIDGRGVRQERREVEARTSADGRFAICGVPSDAPVVVRAELAGDASGEVDLRVPARSMLLRDVLVGRGGTAMAVAPTDSLAAAAARAGATLRRGTARLTGVVRREGGAPFANARVALDGTAAADTTDEAGRFALEALPAGTHALEVRAIGFTPERRAVDLASGRTDTATVVLADRVAALDAVTVYGTARPRGTQLAGFLERRAGGFGHFLTGAEIERRAWAETTDLFRTIPGVTVAPSGGFGSVLLMNSGRLESPFCSPTVFLDGMRLLDGANDLSMIHPSQVAGVEVYTRSSSIPPQFQTDGCGVVVIWTKGALR